jgi:hypothetical protein
MNFWMQINTAGNDEALLRWNACIRMLSLEPAEQVAGLEPE